jgi:hypothetical protein
VRGHGKRYTAMRPVRHRLPPDGQAVQHGRHVLPSMRSQLSVQLSGRDARRLVRRSVGAVRVWQSVTAWAFPTLLRRLSGSRDRWRPVRRPTRVLVRRSRLPQPVRVIACRRKILLEVVQGVHAAEERQAPQALRVRSDLFRPRAIRPASILLAHVSARRARPDDRLVAHVRPARRS